MSLIRAERSFDLLMLLGTLVLPLLSAFPLNAIGLKVPTSASAVTSLTFPDILKMFIIVGGVILISIAVGLWWNRRLWLGNAALFWTIFIVFYTSLFTNGAGIATGLVGSLGYWLEQQGVNRGSQPWYYYMFVQIPVYEYLPALGCLIALALGVINRRRPDLEVSKEAPTSDETLPGPEQATSFQMAPVLGLLGFWVASSLVSYSVAGEKMPWLTVHIALPMILVSGWTFGYLIDTTDWKFMKNSRGWLIVALLFVFVISLAGFMSTLLGNNPPFQGKELIQLQATSNFLTSLVVAIASAWGLTYIMKGWKSNQIARLFTLTILAILTVLTARTAFIASFINYNYANEFLVYAHTGPGAKTALAQIEEISRRTTDGLALAVAYDDKTSYPYWWYLRHYTDVHFYGANPTRDLRDVPAILVGDANYGKIEPVVGQAYYPFEYIRMWWPNQDYFGLTWQRIWNAITNPQMRAALFQIWLNRDYTLYGTLTGKDMSLPNWDPSERFRLYIRKDVAAKLWNYGTSPAPSEIVADPYEGKELVLAADKVFGAPGTEPGQFQNPHNIAVAPDGSLYVLDSGNARVQHLSSEGEVLQVWGSFADIAQGQAPDGTFNDPWGIAVAPDGSVYVADTWNHRIQKFTADGEFITKWGFGISQGEDPFGFYGPRGIAIDAEGKIYITDTGNDRIIVFDSNGGFVTQYGSSGFAPGQFDEPTGITLDAEGLIYITDNWNQRIQSLAPSTANSLSPLSSWDISGWYGKSLQNYPYLSVDRDGHLFATDPEGYRVLEFTTQGEFIRFWGDYGVTNDRFGLPQGLAVDAEGGIWVVDYENARIMHFTLPQG